MALVESPEGAAFRGVMGQTIDESSPPLPAPAFAVVARQAQVIDQLPPTPGTPRAPYTPVAVPAPEWWAEARIPLDDAPAAG